MANKVFKTGDKVNYKGQICEVVTVHDNGVFDLVYNGMPFLPVYMFGVKL